jgi:NAD dependent epimerase/dehydratase
VTTVWDGKKVLVTGAGGFIGSHLVEELASQGARMRAFVRYNSRADIGLLSQINAETLAKIELVFGDLRDSNAVDTAVQDASYVFHLGALIAIPYSYLHPVEVAETNLMGTLNVLMACRQHGVSRLIHTSSSEVYGTAREVPISESHPLQAQSPYSASKIGADKLAESFYYSYGLPVVTLRPFNTYGPRQSARAVIPTIITQALTLPVVRLGNLEAIRDLTYISDTVQGFIKVAMAEGVEGDTYNLGTGQEISVGDLADKIIGLCGHAASIEVDAERLRPERSEVLRLVSDNRLALESLQWSPQITLEEGLLKTINWIRLHLGHFRIGVYEV